MLWRSQAAQTTWQSCLFFDGAMSVPLILSTLMLLMAALTNIVSNNAAAVIGTPIAINVAQQLGLRQAFCTSSFVWSKYEFCDPNWL